MKKILLSMSLLLVAVGMSAVPAKRGVWKTITLADGTAVKVELKGDEFASFWQAADGRCFAFDAATQKYQQTSLKDINGKALAKRAEWDNADKKQAPEQAAPKKISFTGSKKGLIILVQFKNLKFRAENSREQYDALANTENYSSDRGFVGSIRDYFKSQSSGQFDLTFDVVGPVTVSKNYEYYGAPTAYGQDAHVGTMIKEALDLVADQVDFSQYNWDTSDRFVEQFTVIYAGRAEASGGGENTIWPHEHKLSWSDIGTMVLKNGVYLDKYACASELGGNDDIDGLGTFCHEFSHCLGLPDIYDVNYTGGYGMQDWDLMDMGCYNGGGFIPCGYSAYEKSFCGWSNMLELTQDQQVTAKTLADGGDAYVMYNDAKPNEYYILENRQQKGWDSSLPGSGLTITHVDYDKGVWNSNNVNIDKNHQRLSFIAADNSYAYSNVGSDAWPAKVGGVINNALTNYSTPAATLFNTNADGKKFMNKRIVGIKDNGDGTVSFGYRSQAFNTNCPLEGALLYETFDDCAGEGGNNGAFSGSGVVNATFVSDMDGWMSGKSYGNDKCALFGTSTQKGTLIAPMFKLDGECTLVLRVAPFGTDGTSLSLSDNKGTATFSQQTLTMEAGKWTDFSVQMTGNGDVQLVLSPSKRMFVDMIYVMPGQYSGVDGVTVNGNVKADNRIFSIDGRYMGTDFSRLGKGIYVMNGKKIIK